VVRGHVTSVTSRVVRRVSARLGVVHAESDRRRDDAGSEPRAGERYKNPLGVGTVLHVTQWTCDRDEPALVNSTKVSTTATMQ